MINDPRIGKHGEREPRVCAVTGRPVPGKHSSHFGIGDGYYYAVLEIARHEWTEAIHQELVALVQPSSIRKTKTEKED